MLIRNLEFQIYWQLYSDHDYMTWDHLKWSHVFSNSEIEARFVFVFWKEIYIFFYFSCMWNGSEVKPDLGADQLQIKTRTNNAWDTSRLACDQSYWSPFSPGEWPNCVQMPCPAGTRFDCHKHWIFYLARSFGGLIKTNCGSNVPK